MTQQGYAQHKYAQWLATEGARLNRIASEAERTPGGLARRVLSCPDWDLETLIDHCASVWTFVGASLVAGEPVDRSTVIRPEGSLADWHAAALGDLEAVLSAHQPTEASWSFNPNDQTFGFWQRRAAHEATMHRWDAETALEGSHEAIDAELAVDGVDELFDYFLPTRQPNAFSGNGETVHLHATDADGEWVITRTPEGLDVEHAHRKSDVAARGPAQDLLLFVWCRIGPEQLETFGDENLLTEWQRLVRF